MIFGAAVATQLRLYAPFPTTTVGEPTMKRSGVAAGALAAATLLALTTSSVAYEPPSKLCAKAVSVAQWQDCMEKMIELQAANPASHFDDADAVKRIVSEAYRLLQTQDTTRAREMFAYAASYFGDADAQYQLGRLYLDGTPSDPHQAARWFQLAATKGDCRAEAVLGDMLFQGQKVPRQAARGLMLLTLSKDCAGPEENWVKPLYDNALHHASDDERAMALVFLEDWLKGRRE